MKKRLKRALIFSALLHITTLFTPSFAQPKLCAHELHVQIFLNPQTPLIQAEVFIEDLHLLQKTDNKGFAHFTNLCDSIIDLDIWHQGKHLHATFKTKSTIQLISWELDSFVKLAETHIIQHSTHIATDHLHINQLPITPFSSISEKMAEMPMIRLQRTGNSIQKPMLQGLTGLRLPLFQDGLRIQGQAWGSDHAPELGRMGAREITIAKGTEALKRSADGWGNFLEISYRPQYHAFENNAEFTSGYQSNSQAWQTGFSYTHGGHQEHDGFYLSAQHQNAGDYAIPNGILPNTAYKESSVYTGLSKKTKSAIHYLDASYFYFKGGIYLGSHIGNTTDLLNAINAPNPLVLSNEISRSIDKPRQEATHARFSWERKPTSPKGMNLRIGYQRNQRKEFDPHRNSKLDFPQLNIWVHSLQAFMSKQIAFNTWNAQWGMQYEYRDQDWGGFYLAPIYRGNDAAAFFNLEIPNNRKEIRQNATLRYDYIWRTTTLKSTALLEQFGGLSAAYSLIVNHRNQKNELHISFGNRAPSVNERYSAGVHHGSASYEQGNPILPMERGLKVDWEYQYRGKNHSWRSNVYALHSENYIHLNPQSAPLLTIRGAFPHYIYESLPTSIAGINLVYIASYEVGNFEIGGDALWGRIWNPNRYPTQIPPLSLRMQWQHEYRNWVLTLRQTAVARTVFYTAGTDLMPPPSGYMLSDAYVQSPALIKSWDLRIKMGIQNIFNSTYRDYLDRFRYFSPQAGRNFSIQISTNLHHHRNHEIH